MEAMKKALRTVIIALLIVSYVFGQGLMISKGVGLPVRIACAEGTADNEQGQEGVTPADPESTEPEDVGDPAPSEEGEQDPDQEVPGTPKDQQEPEDEPGSPPEGSKTPRDPSEPPQMRKRNSRVSGSSPEGARPRTRSSEPPAEANRTKTPFGVPGQDGDRKGVGSGRSRRRTSGAVHHALWASQVSF